MMICPVCDWSLIHGDDAEQIDPTFHMMAPNHWFCSRCNYQYIQTNWNYFEKIGIDWIKEPKSNNQEYKGFDWTFFALMKLQLINARRYNLWNCGIIPEFLPLPDNFYKSERFK